MHYTIGYHIWHTSTRNKTGNILRESRFMYRYSMLFIPVYYASLPTAFVSNISVIYA